MATENFGDAFKKAVTALHDDAEKLGIPMTRICEGAGVSRATPYRYMNDGLPTTIETVVKLQDEIERRRAASE